MYVYINMNDLNDKELCRLKWEAEETQDGRLLKRIMQEVSKRNKEL